MGRYVNITFADFCLFLFNSRFVDGNSCHAIRLSAESYSVQQQQRPLGSSELIGLGSDLPFLQPSARHQLSLRVRWLGAREPMERVSRCRSADRPAAHFCLRAVEWLG